MSGSLDSQTFVVILTYRVQAASRSEAMELMARYQSDPQFMTEQDLRKFRDAQVVELLDCTVNPAGTQGAPT